MAITATIVSAEPLQNKRNACKIGDLRRISTQYQRNSATIYPIKEARTARDFRVQRVRERADDVMLSVGFARTDGPPPWNRRLSLALDRWIERKEASR